MTVGLFLTASAASAASPPIADARDCAALMLVGGFIAEHQPPLRLRPVTRDVEDMLRGRAWAPVPETWSPDADAAAIARLGQARKAARPVRIACPMEKSPFVPWRPGRAELVLSRPAYDAAAAFAVIDAAVLLPGRRTDFYRFMLNRTASGWDFHREEFACSTVNGSERGSCHPAEERGD
jgi:hypothetical protein